MHPGRSNGGLRIKEAGTLVGRAVMTPGPGLRAKGGPQSQYFEPGYIDPKFSKSNLSQTTTTTVISNPNDLMHTFTLQQMLTSWAGVYIKQQMEFMEVVTGCETGNKYIVYERGSQGRPRGKEMLMCREYSSCCAK